MSLSASVGYHEGRAGFRVAVRFYGPQAARERRRGAGSESVIATYGAAFSTEPAAMGCVEEMRHALATLGIAERR